MREVELSKVIELYERMVEGKDGFFGTYFMETKIEEKLKRLKLMKKTLGDVKMKEDYIKVFLYSGHQASSRSGFTLKEKAIKDVYEVLLKHPDMSLQALDTLIYYHDEECYREFDMISEFSKLLESDKDITMAYWRLVDEKRKEIYAKYSKEAEKLEYLKGQYDEEFIKRIQDAIKRAHVSAEYAISLIPSRDFIEKSSVRVPIGYTIKSGEDIVVRTILGHTDPYSGKDDKKIYLGPCSTGDSVYTSFTKKEYFDELKRMTQLKTIKR